MAINGLSALHEVEDFIEDREGHKQRISPQEKAMLNVVRHDAIHAINSQIDQRLYGEYDRLKLVELEYMYQVRGVRQVMPSAIFREGYAGYGNSWTGSTIRLLYPQDRKRGGRMSREPLLPIDKIKETANLSEQLVPLRINLATDKYRLKDRILWNADDTTIPLELFVEITLEDYGLPLSLAPSVSRSLQEQISNHLPHIYPVPPGEREKGEGAKLHQPKTDIQMDAGESFVEKNLNEEARFQSITNADGDVETDAGGSSHEETPSKFEENPRENKFLEEEDVRMDIEVTEPANMNTHEPCSQTVQPSGKQSPNPSDPNMFTQDIRTVENSIAPPQQRNTFSRDTSVIPSTGSFSPSSHNSYEMVMPEQPPNDGSTTINTDNRLQDNSNNSQMSDNPAAHRDLPKSEGVSDIYDEDMRFTIKLDITIGHHQLLDQFEWDINNPENDPELFGLILANDLALPLEFSTAIAHSIREQVQAYSKALFNSGYQFDGKLPRDITLQNDLAMPVNENQFLRRPELLQSYTPMLADAKISGLDPSAHEQEVERREIRSRRRMGRSSRRNHHDYRPGNNNSNSSDVVFLPQDVRGPDFCTPLFSSALPGGLDRNLSILYMTVYQNDENYGGEKQDLVYYFHKQRRERNIPSVSQYERSLVKFDKPRWIVKLKVPKNR